MCYISIHLKSAQGTSTVGGTASSLARNSDTSSKCSISETQPLLDYALNDAINHLRYLGRGCKIVLQYMKALDANVRLCASFWDNICLHAKRGRHSQALSWPSSRHDFMLYVLVAVAPNSLLNAFLRRAALKPKEGTNPLVYAAYFNKVEHAQTLLLRGANANRRGWEIVICRQAFPLEVALYYRHYAMVAFLVEEGSTVPPHIFSHLLSDRYDPVEIPASTARILLQSADFAEAANGLQYEPISQFALISSESLHVDRSVQEEDLLKIIRRLIQVGCDPFACNSRGATSLHVAIEHGHISIIQYLISLGAPFSSELLVALGSWNIWKRVPILRCLVENGADVCVRTGAGDSVLHIALASFIEEDALDAAELLTGHGCDHLTANSRGETPLQIAVGRGHFSVVRFLRSLGASFPHDVLLTVGSWGCWKKFPMIRYLVENGAKVKTVTPDGDTALHITLTSSNDDTDVLEASKILIHRGCNVLGVNSRGETSLHVAFAQGHVSVVQLLLSHGVPFPNEPSTLSLWAAVARPPMIHFLVENAADVLARCEGGNSILRLAIRSLNEDSALNAAKILINHGCSTLEALEISIKQGHVSIVRHLLSLGTPLPSSILPMSHSWNFWKKAPMIHLLIQNGADVLAHTRGGDSVLHIALRSFVEDDALETAKILVAQGCDPLEPDTYGKPPFQIAAGRDQVSVVEFLLSLGVPLPSTLFVMTGSSETLGGPLVTRCLIEKGVSVLVRTRNGDSTLHITLRLFDENEALETAKLIISHGCDALEAKDSHGKTPLEIAVKRGHASVVRFLLSFGAALPCQLLVTLHSWAPWKKAEILRCLVEHGADVLSRTESGDSVLHITLASFTEDDALDAARLLISRGCNPLEADSCGKTPLQIVAERGLVSVVQYLLSLGVPLHSHLFFLTLHSHNAPKRTPMIRCLLESGAIDVPMRTASGDTYLHIALGNFTEEYALEAAKVLISYGCDPSASNLRGETPMHTAVERGHISVMKHLHSVSARFPGDNLFTILNSGKWLHWQKLEMLKFLVKGGASVLEMAPNGDTLLHAAVSSLSSHNVCSAVEFLVMHGCNPAASTPRGVIPLHIAVERGHIPLVNYLRSRSTPLPSNILFTAIESDCHSTQVETILSLLIESGADVLAVTDNGDTLLHVAVERNYPKVIMALVTSGCSPQTRNLAGHTPLHGAIVKGQVEAVEHLLSVAGVSELEDLLQAAALAPIDVRDKISGMLLRLELRQRQVLPRSKQASTNSKPVR